MAAAGGLSVLTTVTAAWIIRRAGSWRIERAGWMLLFLSAGGFMAVVAHS